MIFVEQAIHEFQYPRKSKENMAINLESHECVILVQSKKIGTHKNKAIHSMCYYIPSVYEKKTSYSSLSMLLCVQCS